MSGSSGERAALAIDGGPRVREEPFPPRRLFGEEEKQAVTRLFDAAMEHGHQVLGYNGPEEEGYCKEFAEFLGGGFADGVNSGTSAVYVALRALQIEPFTEVIVPAISDPGGVMPVVLCNCVPVPADCAPDSYNVGAEQVEARISERTSAVIVAHIAGLPADMGPIVELARGRGIPVIEDCAQSLGASCQGRPVGTIGPVGAFSTMFGKHLASGGQGGMVYTRDEELYWRIRRFADRGKPFGMDSPEGNVVAALNCNMDELHAAIARVQLRKLPAMIESRRRLAKSIAAGCAEALHSVRLVTEPPDCRSVYGFLLLKLQADRLRVDKDAFVRALAAEGMPASPSYWYVPTRMPWCRERRVFGTSELPWSSPLYKGDADRQFELPNAEATDACHFRMDFHEDWTQREVDDLLAALRKVENAYLK
jgi:perosamine synthetase